MQCAPGPPMDLIDDEEMGLLPGGCTTVATTMPTTIGINPSRITRTSSVRYSNSSRHNSHSTFNRTNNNSINNHRHPSNAAYVTIINNRDENSNPAGILDLNDNTGGGGGGGYRGEIDQVFDDCGLIPQIDRPMSMPYLCCKMWRWKELQVDAALHRLEPLPWCRFGRVTVNQATVSCCNPYHYALYLYNR
uniref:MH1 domain-containing protein n=1 Tax=Panagrolaimus sp. PS1159 TaxID=55785 RepID=A0AC35GKN8_9BILA